MKIHKFIIITLIFAPTISQTYFWDSKMGQYRELTPQEIEKRNIDLKYQEKKTSIQQKKEDVSAEARKKQRDLQYKQTQLEIQRQRNQLKTGRP